MYTEEPRRSINWGNLIKKGLIILAIAGIIFLIIWLFTRNNSNAVNVNYEENNNNNINETLNPNSYSEEFINNYRYFHDTAKEYFLVSELPEDGKSLKYTLQELIDKGLILPFNYQGEICDPEASYVTVTNNNGEYTMTTTLVCGVEVAKTTVELGCNQLCETGNCEKEELIIEYQYKQAYKDKETTYSCPSGYTKNGTKCIKSDKNTIESTKNVSYSCPSGYTKNGDKCIKSSTSTIDATKNVSYSCPNGYTKDGEKCYKTTNNSVDATANTTYSCTNGYKLNGTSCTKSTISTINATPSTSYTCSKGSLVNTSYCRVTTTKSYYDSYTIYKGTSYNGCSYSGSYTAACSTYAGCTRTYYKYYCSKSSYKDVAATANTTYSCPSGYTKNGTICTKTTTDTKAATANTTYKCSEGYKLDGKKCIKTTSENINATKKTTYNCPDGYTKDGTKCTIKGTSTKNLIKNTTYSCKDGYTKIGIGSTSVCTKGSTTTIDATKSTKEVTKYRYKWSSETNIDGWERTDKTRTSSK